MARQTTVLVKDLREDDTITMAPPRMKVLSKKPLSSEYNTSIKGYILEVRSLDPRMKGYTTIILLADTDTVKMNARPSWMQRMSKRWKAYTSEVKKRNKAKPSFQSCDSILKETKKAADQSTSPLTFTSGPTYFYLDSRGKVVEV